MHTREMGNKGEDIACEFLKKNGFHIVARNYLRKWGELDIVAEKDKLVHFFEVKSVSHVFSDKASVHRPEDNVHGLKVRKLRRIIETFMDETGRGWESGFQFHVICVYINPQNRTARVQWIKNIIL